MKIHLIFVGKTRESYIKEGVEDYLNRLRRYVPVRISVVRAERLERDSRTEKVMEIESERVAAQVPPDSHLVLLDRRGKQMSSEGLARWWSKMERQGLNQFCFAIGGVLGFSDSLLRKAGSVLSLSKMTFTHEMSRLIVLEQLYRACAIMRGEKYHR